MRLAVKALISLAAGLGSVQAFALEDHAVPFHLRDRLRKAQRLRQAFADRLQNLVPGLVAVFVVDALEPVQVEHDQGERVAEAHGVVVAVVFGRVPSVTVFDLRRPFAVRVF